MKIRVNGKELFVDVEGQGLVAENGILTEKPTLILLHGAPGNSDHTVFKPMFSELTDAAQIIYLDMCGCGRSDESPDGTYSLESWADDIVGLCDVLGINKPLVLGNSAGGMVAATYAIKYPDHPGKIVLSSTQAKLRPERCLPVFERLGGQRARTLAEAALVSPADTEALLAYARECMPLYNPTPQTRPRTSIFRKQSAEAFHLRGGVWHTMDFLDELGRITCPTLVLAGDQDPVTPIEDSEDIVANLNHDIVTYERFENAGHGVWLDNPERAFKVLRDFVAGATPHQA